MHLTVLVPARNAGGQLDAWYESVARFADGVVALDDGSTDDTRARLASFPLTVDLLTNPVRRTYRGWDDLENRQRLVHAALAHRSQWLLFLDADERIDRDDGKALAEFVRTDARPGYAYGFEVSRMIDDDEHHDPTSIWVFRLFAGADARTPLGSQRLHFVPVPSGIPRRHWIFTSLRIQHVASISPSARTARFKKYLEADPECEFQSDYTNVLRPPKLIDRWEPRSPTTPLVLGVDGRYADHALDQRDRAPAITAIVIAQNDENTIARSLDALVAQQLDDEVELLLVDSGTDRTLEVAARYPQVRAVRLPDPARPGEARNAGLWMANGDYVSFPGSHTWLAPGSLRARVGAHDGGWDMVSGAVLNGNETPAGWASYILDHATTTPARPEGPMTVVPGSASYVRADLLDVGGFPDFVRAGEDTHVNRTLFLGGKRVYFDPAIRFHHACSARTAPQLIRHHFERGRALGRLIAKPDGRLTRKMIRTVVKQPSRRLSTIRRFTRTDPDLDRVHRGHVRTLVRAGAVSAAFGAAYELLTTRRRAAPGAPPADRISSASPSSPLLMLSGRPGEARRGLLAAGSARQAATRLSILARYASHRTAVRAALAPIVMSATLTAERSGRYHVELGRDVVERYRVAALAVDAGLVLQMQPGRADLDECIDSWRDVLTAWRCPVLMDVRPEVAFRGQADQLEVACEVLAGLGVPMMARGPSVPSGVRAVDEVRDLRVQGTPFPHQTEIPPLLMYE